jgi:hypothetical protein
MYGIHPTELDGMKSISATTIPIPVIDTKVIYHQVTVEKQAPISKRLIHTPIN